ncbi:MAG: hypothetical protein WAM86_13545 [Candidatus Sulfotelmatobacter sp.]|jgi:rhodanese-related sulfurtransferase
MRKLIGTKPSGSARKTAAATAADSHAAIVVRVRETQEYDIEVPAGIVGQGLEAVRRARLKFLGMTVEEQSANSVGVTSRIFEIEDEKYDDDGLARDG